MQRSISILFFLVYLSVCQAQGPVRIITAGSAITETVCALGDCDKIVASDRTSLYPEKIQKLPSIGYRSSITAEGILSLKPTLVIAEKDYLDDVVLQQLSGAHIKLVVVDRKLNFDDTKKFIQQIAVVLNRRSEGEKLISGIEEELASATALLKSKTTTPKVVCIYNRGSATVTAAGKETFAEILKYAGAENAFADINGYKSLNTESLIEANPEYFLMVSSGFESIGGIEGVLNIPGVALTTAGKKKQIIAIETLKLTNFGPRFGEAVTELVLKLHPELAAK